MFRLLLLPTFAGLLAAIPVAPASAQTCPESCIEVPGPEPDCTTLAIRSRSANGGHGTGSGNGGYDLTAGRVGADASSSNYGGGAIVTARDDFRVVGLPDGTPLSFTATFDVSFSGAREAYFEAGLQDDVAA